MPQQAQSYGKSQPVRISTTLTNQRHIRFTERVEGRQIPAAGGDLSIRYGLTARGSREPETQGQQDLGEALFILITSSDLVAARSPNNVTVNRRPQR